MFLNDNQLTGEIPPEIGNLINLERLYLNDNQLIGLISESICDLDINWSSSLRFKISNNQLCPPYPDCGNGPITSKEDQNTSNCP